MIDFINRVNNILYKELKVKHLKVIYKSLLGDTPDAKTVFANFDNILREVTFLKDKEIFNLNFVEYFLLITELRITSIGDTVFAQLENNTTADFNLNRIKSQLQNNLDKFNNKKYEYDNITVVTGLPTINDIISVKNVNSFYSCFIKTITVQKHTTTLTELFLDEKNKIFEQLPAKVSSHIIKDVLSCIEYFNNINLISYFKDIQNITLAFNFNINNLVMYLKFLFGDGLLPLYENIFGLCKIGNFTPEYIENCTPGEYLLFVKKLEQLNAQNKQQTNNINENFVDEDFDLPPITSEADLNSLQ